MNLHEEHRRVLSQCLAENIEIVEAPWGARVWRLEVLAWLFLL